MKALAAQYAGFRQRRMLDRFEDAVDHWPGTLAKLEQEIAAGNEELFSVPEFQRGFNLQLPFEARKSQQKTLTERGVSFAHLSEHPATYDARLHHLLHLSELRLHVPNVRTELVVEFGGGFGGMASLMDAETYVILDFPVMNFLQAYYLRKMGREVNLVTDENDPIKKGAINLVPIFFLRHWLSLSRLDPDLFVATWSLCEAGPNVQKSIKDEAHFFGAKVLFTGYSHTFQFPPNYFDGLECIYHGPGALGGGDRYGIYRQ